MAVEAALAASNLGPEWFDLPVRMTVVTHGLRIGLGANSRDHLVLLKSMLPPGVREATAKNSVDFSCTLSSSSASSAQRDGGELIATVAGQELVRSANRQTVLQTLERYLQLHVAENAPRRVFVHAGVVGWQGKAIVVPGRTFSGKSTLVAALVQAGATYYSDEFAIVDSTGQVHPYQQPIKLRDAHGAHDPAAASNVRMTFGRKAMTVDLILITGYSPGGRWRPTPVSAGVGMLTMLANTVSAQRDPKRAMQHLARLLEGARVLKGTRGEAAAMVRQMIRAGYLPG